MGVEWAEHKESVAGLIPQAGDIIYFRGIDFNEHICVSLGPTWSAGLPEDETFSLWHHNGGTFDLITVAELARHAGNDIYFAPCPFGFANS